MGVDVLRCRPLHRLAELPTALWLSIHVLFYLGLGAMGFAGYALWDLHPRTPLAESLSLMIIGVLWLSPLWVFVSVAATFCLGVLRLLSDVRWYWFRLAAVLLFAVPFPLFVLSVYGPEAALPVAGAQLATALLIVQPRKKPGRWADRDPAIEDHRW
ncbi:hypothetical protein [Plantactinospora soyae]|uniref:Energy-coupling factor transporter transmembrane protein EcfT n=1 Tax=Plantactinospora soyae TaxID=1544732 RepID=A0A927QXX8_9ACTN|nr:hypothetical protein [Plantactinospora soyae]MBE1488580.1 energy-coupling factor transporter transmembrane protein EcfT [Plantactinospora soyae]